MPTSLIFVLLAAAWLVVLVPIVARRREKVPEMDESGARFRVLHRASTSMRKRRGPRRSEEVETLENTDNTDDTDETDELDELDELDEDSGPLEQELLDDDEDVAASAEGTAEPEAVPVPEPVRREYAGARPMRGNHLAHPDSDEEAVPAAVAVAERPERRTYEPEQVEDVDDERYRPIPQRRGRGGYDPDAAARVKAYRYIQRRRVTAVMLLATIAFSLVAYLAKLPVLWSGTVVFGLLLVGYLAYLRRQVRIEEDIRQRRLAKMHRARQIRPEYHVSERGTARRPAAPEVQVTSEQRTTSVPPAAYARNRQVVDLDDDDPGFDDLEYFEPYQYRRAAGQ